MRKPASVVVSISGLLALSFGLLAGCNGTFTPPTNPMDVNTPTLTDTPCSLCSPTPTKTPTNTPLATATKTPTATLMNTATATATKTITPVPPTRTPTVNATATIPMGVVVIAAFDGSVINYGGFSVTISGNEVGISYNRAADATASVTLVTPSNGSLPLAWAQDINMGTYILSQYSTSTQFTYTPNAVYSVNVSGTWGTASASMNAPGSITFSANGASVTALYPGTIDEAQVAENSPTARSVYVSDPNVSVGSPYVYSGSYFPDSPGNYTETYSAGLTVTSFMGTAGAQGAFVGNQSLSSTFNW